jgi:hypothetical protein
MKINPASSNGSVRLILFFIIIIGALFWFGGQGLYTALTNRNPTVMSYDDYVKTKPTSSWLSLTNCTLDLSDASYKSIRGSKTPTELFIPIHGADESNEVIYVLVATKSPELLKTMAEIQALNSEKDAITWMIKNRERAFPKRDVSGLVRFGIEMDDKDRRKLANLQSNLAKDFIILDDGKEPEMIKSLGLLGVGVAAIVGGVAFLRRNREPSAADAI